MRALRHHSVRLFSSAARRFDVAPRRERVLLGCVSYDPSVGSIWAGMSQYFAGCALDFDFVLFSNYESQVRSLLDGHIDVAWNGPIAHVLAESQAAAEGKGIVSLGMRDVDRDFRSLLVVPKDKAAHAITSDLSQGVVITGSSDSPQAHVVPLHFLQEDASVTLGKVESFDEDMGKHGDTALGEIRAMEALAGGYTCDGAVLSEMMWTRAVQGLLPSVDADKLLSNVAVASNIELPVFDHCQFDALTCQEQGQNDKLARFSSALFDMDWENPAHQPVMKAEGIQRRWEKPRQSGYKIVRQAMGTDLGGSISTDFDMSAVSSGSRRSFSSSSTSGAAQSVGVIGAGVAGLQAVRALLGNGFTVNAFDAAPKVGGLWQANYANFGVQVPKELYELNDFPMSTVPAGAFPSGPQVQSYIENYADHFNLGTSVQLETWVSSAIQEQDGRWTLQTQSKQNGEQKYTFDFLVDARGLYSGTQKNLPKAVSESGSEFGGQILHSSGFTDSSLADGKRVVVIGGAKSAIDIACEASRAGAASVHMVHRQAHWPTPRKIAGLIPFQYVFLSRLGTALVSAHRGALPGASGPAVNAFHKFGAPLMRPIFAAVEQLFALQLGLNRDRRPSSDVVEDFYGYGHVLNGEFQALRGAGQIKTLLGEAQEFQAQKLVLDSGESLDADLVICATGFQQDYDIFAQPAVRDALQVESDGLYLYRHVLPPRLENLAFIGKAAAISNSSSYGIQAEWLARALAARNRDKTQWPTRADMERQVADHKAWARSWMPSTASRGSLILLHQTHYHDQLLREMGEEPLRKSNSLAEYLMPYTSLDYNGIMSSSHKHQDSPASDVPNDPQSAAVNAG